ncbi:MAG: hypothetical protein IPP45_00150 [Sphingomonadales bacterium]|nr:hypothetical protein [Sphingomonadales bacterium]
MGHARDTCLVPVAFRVWGQSGGADEAAIANQAESLERAANATTDQLIKQIEDGAKAEDAANVRAVTQLAEDDAAKR